MSELKVIISGKAKSGKTGLAFKIAEWLHKEGIKALIIDDNGLGRPDEHLNGPDGTLANYQKKFDAIKNKTDLEVVISTQQANRKGI